MSLGFSWQGGFGYSRPVQGCRAEDRRWRGKVAVAHFPVYHSLDRRSLAAAGRSRITRLSRRSDAKSDHFSFLAFSLVELLFVMAFVALLLVLLVPAFTTMSTGSTVTSMANSIKSAFENARTYAKANNTYVFVGIGEFDASRDPVGAQVGGVGRVAIAAVASKDGTRHYAYTDTNQGDDWTATYNNGANLMAIGKLQVYENLHFSGVNFPSWTPTNHPNSNLARYQTSSATYNIGTSTSVTGFTWPLGSPPDGGQYKFTTVINFDPRGVARVATQTNADEVTDLMEIDFQQAHGTAAPALPTNQDVGNHFVIQIDAPTGAVRLYRP